MLPNSGTNTGPIVSSTVAVRPLQDTGVPVLPPVVLTSHIPPYPDGVPQVSHPPLSSLVAALPVSDVFILTITTGLSLWSRGIAQRAGHRPLRSQS